MNHKIIIAAVVIAGAGVVNAWTNKKPLTPVILGAYILVIVLSLMDMFGGGLSTLAGAIAMLAVTYVVLTEVPWNQFISIVQGKKQ